MFRDFFVNGVVIIACISVGGQIYRNKGIRTDSGILKKFIFGLLCGIVGIFLMSFSVRITSSFIMDFRNIAIILSAIAGGMLSSITTGAVIVIFRMGYFGVDAYSIAAMGTVFIMSFICGVISWMKTEEIKKWTYMFIFNLTTSALTLCILMGFNPPYITNITYFIIGNIITSVFVYYYYMYIYSSNRMYRQLKDESTRDFLTGLNNVRGFDKLFNLVQGRAKERNEKFSILMIDIDFFKRVNDTYGHHEGDIVLKELGGILIKTVRGIDIVSRNGGEEFSAILVDCNHKESLEIGERIRKVVEDYEFILSSGKKIKVTVSIGLATYMETINDIDRIMEQADMALYKAKRTGRNRVCSAFDI